MKFWIYIFALFACNIALACNSCGCFIGSGISGLNLQNSQWNLRYGSQYRSFNTIHPSDDVFAFERHTNEKFWQNNVQISYAVKPWLNVSIGAQFSVNTFTELPSKKTLSGLGNISFGIGSQKVLFTQANGNNAYWLGNIAFALPTGNYKGNFSDDFYSESLYPSTGSVNYSVQSAIIYNADKTLYFTQVAYSLNSETPNNYRFGASLSTTIGVQKNVWVISDEQSIALGADVAWFKSYPNQYYGKKLPDNNGTYTLLNAQVAFKSSGFSVFAKKAFVIQQNIGSGNTQIQQQLEIGLTKKL